jgi:hypothetical protein
MTNIAITSRCNLACDYCFAQASVASSASASPLMNRATFERALDFVDRSAVDEIRLLGGEPTLHPDFVSFLQIALERGKPIRIFSNGRMPAPVLAFINTVAANRLSFVVNVSASVGDEQGMAELEVCLARLAERAMIGINISRPWTLSSGEGRPDPIGFLLDLVDKHGLRRSVRVGIAHPCVGFHNASLRSRDYSTVGRSVLQLEGRARERGVTLKLDCGFVPCMFPALDEAQARSIGQQTGRHCSPVLDILPDGRAIPCFPLATVLSANLEDGHTAKSVRAEFEARLGPYRVLGIVPACAGCESHTPDVCRGGCLAVAMNRLAVPDFAFEPAQGDE